MLVPVLKQLTFFNLPGITPEAVRLDFMFPMINCITAIHSLVTGDVKLWNQCYEGSHRNKAPSTGNKWTSATFWASSKVIWIISYDRYSRLKTCLIDGSPAFHKFDIWSLPNRNWYNQAYKAATKAQYLLWNLISNWLFAFCSALLCSVRLNFTMYKITDRGLH